MLVTKIRSVVEVSEKTEIQNESLRKWQQTFKDAATQGDEELRKLQDEVNSSSSPSSSSGISSIKRLISGTEDMKKLKSTIELLEQSSVEVKDFLKILKLELSEVVKQRRILDLELAPEALQQKIEINKVGRDHEAYLGNRSPPRGGFINFTDHVKPKMLETEEDPKLHESMGQAPDLHETAKPHNIKRRKPAKSLERAGLTKRAKPAKPNTKTCAEQDVELKQDLSFLQSLPNDLSSSPRFGSRGTEICHLSDSNAVMSEECTELKFEYAEHTFLTSKPDFRSDKDKDLMSAECTAMGGLKDGIISWSKDPRFPDFFGGEEENIGRLVKGKKLVTPNLPHSLSSRTIEEELTAVWTKIQSALDMAMKHGAVEDGWFGQLIAKLREAHGRMNSVASAIKSNNYCVYDQISDEVGKTIQDDLEDFTNLAEVEELVRELTPAGPSIAHT